MSKGRRQDTVPAARVKVWIEVDGAYVFGRGICAILQAVRDSGSIKQAADDVGKSYRHVWARIKAAEQAIGDSLVVSRVGGSKTRRSELTPLAEELVADFARLRASLIETTEREFASGFQRLRTTPRSAVPATAGSRPPRSGSC
jgi:molybdate transport system regulatory protein